MSIYIIIFFIYIILGNSYRNSKFFNSLKTFGNISLFLFIIVLREYLNIYYNNIFVRYQSI